MTTGQAAKLLRLLGNEARLGLVLRIGAGEVSVADLEAELAIRQPNLSQHLAELREAGLLASRREGRTVLYTLADARAEAIVECLAKAIGHEVPRRGAAAAPESAPASAAGSAVFARVGGRR
jgi:DNA-binding transcriptional ArsR family regulator